MPRQAALPAWLSVHILRHAGKAACRVPPVTSTLGVTSTNIAAPMPRMHKSALVALALSAITLHAMATVDVLALWNFDDPAASENRFRELAKTANPEDQAILETQIARTYGLRRRFDETRKILSTVQPRLASLGPEANVRYYLEYGRSLVSATHKAGEKTETARTEARAAYLRAFELARQANLDYLAIDALHMLPFVEPDVESSLKWTKQALDLTVASTQPESRKWEPTLRSNYGYYLHNQGKYEDALEVFRSNIPVTEKTGNVTRTRIAHWMVAWALRTLGNLDEALAIQLRLEAENAKDSTPDQYVFEELATIYKMKGDAERSAHYAHLHEQQKRAEAK